MAKRRRATWGKDDVRKLRAHLGMTQQELADEMGTRQQTISEWETGMYQPRGASLTLLNLVAERAGFAYGQAASQAEETPGDDG
ncbi:MAG: helix-turn-helix domain-containing protein [Dehalococcoidia bacterium]